MSNANDPAPLTLAELRLAAAAVTALLPKYARPHPLGKTSPTFLKLKRLQLRMFEIEREMAPAPSDDIAL